MRLQPRSLLWMIGCLLLVGSGGMAAAAEPFQPFVEGLRDRQLHDYAILYLESLEARSDLPNEIRELIPFEKGITLVEGSRLLRSAEERGKQLDSARLFLEQFVKSLPSHPKAAAANTELAKVLIEKGRVEVLQARSPSNVGKRAEFLKRAREFVLGARSVFQKAHDQYKAEYESYPISIDEQKEREKYEAREAVYVKYILAQLNLATTVYEEAQTHDRGTEDYKRLLTQASKDFEQIHNKYRSQVAGLHARMMQGKCFEEQDDIVKALGIYAEILGHPGKSPALSSLQDRVLRFELVCLNHEQRKDYQLVIQKAADWMKSAGTALRNQPVGLGIQYEQARAYEMLAGKEEQTPGEKERLLRSALTTATNVNRFGGEFKDLTTVMIQRIKGKLNVNPLDPKDFEEAFGLAKDRIQQISAKRTAIQEAPSKDEADRLQGDLENHLRETSRLLRLALKLARPKDTAVDLFRARYFLAFAEYQSASVLKSPDRFYDAAVAAEFAARRGAVVSPDIALSSAFLAMTAYKAASNNRPVEDRAVEVARIVSLAKYIAGQWPASDKALDAWMELGDLYSQMQSPQLAAEAYNKIPDTSELYIPAQIKSGSAYWSTYVMQVQLPEAERMPKAELDQLPLRAVQTLRDSVLKQDARLPEGAPADPLVSGGKLTLAQILNENGDYTGSVALITGEPRSLVAAVAVSDPAQRGNTGITSKRFAAEVYRQLLRGYVGLKQIDQARNVMRDLETLEGGSRSPSLAATYLDLGRQLEKEVQRLQRAGDPRLQEVLASFDGFLGEMARQKEGANYSTLLWIAETYLFLGEGVQDGDRTRAMMYYEKANVSLDELIQQAKTNAAFAPEGGLTSAQMKLVECQMRRQQFDTALAMIREILTKSPRRLDAQILAARLFEAWASRGEADDYKKWMSAIEGEKSKSGDKVIWGWNEIGERLARNLQQVSQQPANSTTELLNQYLEARFQVATDRMKYALQQPDAKRRGSLLERARQDIIVTTSLSDDLGGEESWERFNKLYRTLQQEQVTLGLSTSPVTNLERRIRSERVEATAAADKSNGSKTDSNTESSADDDATNVATAETKSTKSKSKTTAGKASKSRSTIKGTSTTTMVIAVGGVVAIVTGLIGFFYLRAGSGAKTAKSAKSATVASAASGEKPATPGKSVSKATPGASRPGVGKTSSATDKPRSKPSGS